ncbi:hypothetical protein F908_00467 [Acinetobacter sp. NIPH 284]|nr:hypothetical protein F908_00467 [Acinetobacter sp. NIPH 284]
MEMQQQTTLLKTAIALLFQHFFCQKQKKSALQTGLSNS